MTKPLKMGMVGGGQGAFIGDVHRLAARLDGHVELVCGVFSRNSDNNAATGRALGLDSQRCYQNFEMMIAEEARRPENERMDFVSIVTPNHVHFPVAKAALNAGFHVLSDKPATLNLKEAKALRKIVQESQKLYGLTHTYLGYPMIQEARTLVATGAIGPVRKVFVEYIQGWLAKDEPNNKQADWRTDPARSGGSGCMGDIGTHAHNLAEYICGARMTHLAADLTAFVPGRRLDDDGSCLFQMEGGIKGTLSASQICVGEENGLSIRVFGEKGGLSWSHKDPNTLLRYHVDRPTEILRAAQGYLSEPVQSAFRTPAGHPEGYIEAFANCYLDFVKAVRGERSLLTGIDGGVRGMAFVDALLKSSAKKSKWVEIDL